MQNSNGRKSDLEKYLDESSELEIKEDDIRECLSIFERVPPILLKIAVKRNMNAVKSFESQIVEYKTQLTEDDKVKIRGILELPISKLQELLDNIYFEAKLKQFKILADSKSKAFLELNLQELRKVLFDEI